jgi:hypothetical protein
LSDCVPGAAIFSMRQIRSSCRGSAVCWLISGTFAEWKKLFYKKNIRHLDTTEAGDAAGEDRVETRGDMYVLYCVPFGCRDFHAVDVVRAHKDATSFGSDRRRLGIPRRIS